MEFSEDLKIVYMCEEQYSFCFCGEEGPVSHPIHSLYSTWQPFKGLPRLSLLVNGRMVGLKFIVVV